MSEHPTSDEGHSYVISNLYKDPDFPFVFRNFVLDSLDEKEEFVASVLYRIYQDRRFRGKKLVDVGCGPTAYRMATPSKFFSEIILCEFAEGNLDQLKEWLNESPSALDWTPSIRKAAKLEEFSDLEKGIKEIEARIRNKVKKVLPCDVLKKEVLPPEVGQVDVLFTSYCLENACPSPEVYRSVVIKLGTHVKLGGGLIMVVILDMPTCCRKTPTETYKCDILPVSQTMVNDVITAAGFKKIHCYFMENNEKDELAEHSGTMVVSAIKIK